MTTPYLAGDHDACPALWSAVRRRLGGCDKKVDGCGRVYYLGGASKGDDNVTHIQKLMAARAPELDALHMETLAYAIGSTLNGMPREFFDKVAACARQMGPQRLAEFHTSQVAA